jgi:hypothetical protein
MSAVLCFEGIKAKIFTVKLTWCLLFTFTHGRDRVRGVRLDRIDGLLRPARLWTVSSKVLKAGFIPYVYFIFTLLARAVNNGFLASYRLILSIDIIHIFIHLSCVSLPCLTMMKFLLHVSAFFVIALPAVRSGAVSCCCCCCFHTQRLTLL